jgi:hypothetical protein
MLLNFIRPDLLFTYWIFAWSFGYLMRFPVFSWYNPTLLLILGALQNVYTLFHMVKQGKRSMRDIIYFSLINLFLKVYPLYLLSVRRQLRISSGDLIASVVLAWVYVTWCHLNNQTVQGIYNNVLYPTQNSLQSPSLYLLHQIEKWLKKSS